jgi:hypothetical protein
MLCWSQIIFNNNADLLLFLMLLTSLASDFPNYYLSGAILRQNSPPRSWGSAPFSMPILMPLSLKGNGSEYPEQTISGIYQGLQFLE